LFISMHLFTATWQYQQLGNIKENIPDNWVIMIQDFAENYRTFYQDEIQSAHWQYEQATVHPVICYYQCQEKGCRGNCNREYHMYHRILNMILMQSLLLTKL
jgi:hypothetical protein